MIPQRDERQKKIETIFYILVRGKIRRKKEEHFQFREEKFSKNLRRPLAFKENVHVLFCVGRNVFFSSTPAMLLSFGTRWYQAAPQTS